MEVLQEWADKYGRVYGYYIGLRPQLNITDLDIVKEIYIKQFSNFVNRPVSCSKNFLQHFQIFYICILHL